MANDEGATNIKVMVRMRLFNSREIKDSKVKKEKLRPCVRMRNETTCVILEHITDDKGFTKEVEREAFGFDQCFWSMPDDQGMADRPYATQQYVYESSGLVAMNAAFSGYNTCIFAYGQTGAGKTYSMLGTQSDPGVSPRICDDIFVKMKQVHEETLATTKCVLECTFFEIYNEKVRDLFNKKTKVGHYDAPKIRQHPTKGVYVDGLTKKELMTAEEAKNLIEKGTNERAVAETKMNKHSSRSHAVFQITLTQLDAMKGTQKSATINLVDLAGSEKIKKSEAEGMTFTEATNINKSLSTLRRVIDVLIENSLNKRQKVPPFREAVLTYVLSDSLGGNSKTQMIAAISPHISNIEDTLGTLRYALRAKDIVCNAKVNEEDNAEMVDAMRDEIDNLKRQMRSGGGAGGAGRAMMPDEIEKEIKMREAEMTKMQEGMSVAVQEAKIKEEELNNEIAAAKEQEMALSTAVTTQKRERFAAAFRNAFTIAKDKKKIAAAGEELDRATEERDLAVQQNNVLRGDLTKKTDEHAQTSQQLAETKEALDALKSRTGAEHDRLTRHNEEVTQLTKSLEEQLELATAELSRAQGGEEEAVSRVERMQEDMVGLAHAVEREQTEKSNITFAFEEATVRSNKAIEASRRRKEKYKQLHGEEETRATSLKEAIASHTHDRRLLLETIKAQQSLLDEKEKLIIAAHSAQDEAHQKAQQFEELALQRKEEVEQLVESLREYQSSASKWMMEHSLMEKEVARLRLGQDRSRVMPSDLVSTMMNQKQQSSSFRGGGGVAGRAGSPVVYRDAYGVSSPTSGVGGGSRPYTPRRTQSPSASRTRSPYFTQPSVNAMSVSNNSMVNNSPSMPKWSSPR